MAHGCRPGWVIGKRAMMLSVKQTHTGERQWPKAAQASRQYCHQNNTLIFIESFSVQQALTQVWWTKSW